MRDSKIKSPHFAGVHSINQISKPFPKALGKKQCLLNDCNEWKGIDILVNKVVPFLILGQTIINR